MCQAHVRSQSMGDWAQGRPAALLVCRDDGVRLLIARWLRETGYAVRYGHHGYEPTTELAPSGVHFMVLNGVLPRRRRPEHLLLPKDTRQPPILLIPEAGDAMLTPILKLHGIDVVLPRPLTRTGFLTALVGLQ
jgi:hypothetical protein